MGLFKFVKEAGAKLFGGGSAQAATPDALKKTVEGHGFDASKLGIEIQGDKVKLSGQAVNQADAEKIILALGNTIGVAEVDIADAYRAKTERLAPVLDRACQRAECGIVMA